jgi:1D-myo-inositol 3-kinase
VSFDYTTVGHVTADVMADGSRRPGGSAFYGALQAARLGRRTLILTQGVRKEIEELLAPFLAELELQVIDAAHTTALQTAGIGAERSQRMLAWAGGISANVSLDTTILHLAPVAQETPSGWRGRAEFVGLTPQGLVRAWSGEDARIAPVALDRALLPARCDAIVISRTERDSCASLLGGPGVDRARGAVVAVTAGASATELELPDGERARVAVAHVADVRDDIGAGDVFAAAFFIALSEGRRPREAASFANAAAAVRIAGSGANAVGERTAIESRLAAVA